MDDDVPDDEAADVVDEFAVVGVALTFGLEDEFAVVDVRLLSILSD